MADEEERIRRCVCEELELNLVSRTRNLIHSAVSSSVPELNNVFADQTAQRSSFGSSSRVTVKRQNILGPKKPPAEQELCFQSLVVKRKDVLGVWKSLIYPASTKTMSEY